MRKSILFLSAFAALSFTACVKEAGDAPRSVSVNFTATKVETKTAFGTPSGNTYPTLWTTNDTQAGIALNLSNPVAADITPSADGKTATFKAQFEEVTGPITFVAYNPISAIRSMNAANKTLNIEFPAGQTSTSTSPDENAQIIYAVSETYSTLPEEVSLQFKHVSAYLHLSFTNVTLDDAAVNAVNLTSSKKIAGRWFFNLEDKSFDENAGGYSIGISTTSLESVWCGLLPTDLSGESIKFVIATDKGTLTKTVTLPANSVLTPGKIAKLTVDMSGISLVSPQVYKKISSTDELHFGDKIIIVSSVNDRALATTQNSNNRSAADVVKDGDIISDPADAVQVLTLEMGTKVGAFALNANGQYLYAAGGGNYLRSQNGVDDAASWEISIDAEGNHNVVSYAPGITQVHLRYNNNTNADSSVNNLFSCYASTTSCKHVEVYRLDVAAVNTPCFAASVNGKAAINTNEKAKDIPIIILGNVAWTATVDGDGASLSKNSGNGAEEIQLSVPENTSSSDRTFTVTVSTTADVAVKSFELVITQKGVTVNPGVKVDDVLWSENWAGGAKDKTPAAYQALETASTVVYGGGSVTYSSANGGSTTKLYDDALVYVPSTYSGSLALPENPYNLLISKGKGWWKIEDIPCAGVKTATLKLYSNYGTNAYFSPSSDTDGVSFGSISSSNYTSDWKKKVYVNTYTVSFDGSADSFNLTLTNTNSSNNVRVTDLSLVVTEVQ